MKWLDNAVLLGPHLMLCLSEKPYLKIKRKFKIKSSSPWVMDGKAATAHFFPNSAMENDGISSIAIICIRPDKLRSYN